MTLVFVTGIDNRREKTLIWGKGLVHACAIGLLVRVGVLVQRLRGREVVFVTGTDEHGEKIALSAAANGKSPKEHTDSVAESYKALWAKVRIGPSIAVLYSAVQYCTVL